jgi:hypothetical protein
MPKSKLTRLPWNKARFGGLQTIAQFPSRSPKQSGQCEGQALNNTVILNQSLKEKSDRGWTGLVWLNRVTSGGPA